MSFKGEGMNQKKS